MTALSVLGDSMVAAVPGFVDVLAARLGWAPIRHSFAGSGFVHDAGPGGRFDFHVSEVLADNPDVILVVGGYNDSTTTAIEEQYAGYTLDQMLGRKVYVACLRGTDLTAIRLRAIGIRNATVTRGMTYIDTLTEPWTTGNGNVAVPNGSGNTDVYLAADGVHPSTAGYAYIGTRLAFAIKPPATGLDY